MIATAATRRGTAWIGYYSDSTAGTEVIDSNAANAEIPTFQNLGRQNFEPESPRQRAKMSAMVIDEERRCQGELPRVMAMGLPKKRRRQSFGRRGI